MIALIINQELARQNFKNLHRIKLKLNRNSKAVLVFVKDAGSWMLTKISIFKRRFCRWANVLAIAVYVAVQTLFPTNHTPQNFFPTNTENQPVIYDTSKFNISKCEKIKVLEVRGGVDLRYGPLMKGSAKAKQPHVRRSKPIQVHSSLTPVKTTPTSKGSSSIVHAFSPKKGQVTPMLQRGLQLAASNSYTALTRQIAKQENKSVVKVNVYGTDYKITNPDRFRFDVENRLSARLYDDIRSSTTDIKAISKQTGLKSQNIEKIKQHVFENKHILDMYPGESSIQRFDPDLEQALAWKRLEKGRGTTQDVEWLKHEYAERHFETKYKTGYKAAHERAQARHDGKPWTEKPTQSYVLRLRTPPGYWDRLS